MLGDINAELIAMYGEVRDHTDDVVAALNLLRKGKDEFLQLRAMDPESMSATERCARFIYLNRFCFNGLYRTNLKGRFNVPYGGDRTGSIPDVQALGRCSHLLKKAELVAGDFECVLERVRPGDFVYLDPPFAVKGKRVFKEYDPASFGTDDIQRLRCWLEVFAGRDIPFLVSYAECEEADILREGFLTRSVTVRRNIAGFAGHRARCTELLISNRRPSTD